MAAALQLVAPPPDGLGCTKSEFDHILLLVDLRAAIRALYWKRSGRRLPCSTPPVRTPLNLA